MGSTNLKLPAGYSLTWWDADVLVLRGPEGEEVAKFSACDATHEGVRLAAENEELHDARLDVCFLGEFAVRRGGEALSLVCNAKALAILKYMLYHRDCPVSRDHLMGWLWPESSARRARWSLNSAIYVLRELLSDWFPRTPRERLIVCEDGHYRLCAILKISTDVDEFDAHCGRGRRIAQEGRMPEAAVQYEEAAALYRGDFLIRDLYEDWTMIERERLLNAYVDALSQLLGYYAETGRYEEAIETSYRLLEKDPCNEGTYRALMTCYAERGLPTLAERQYRVCAEFLARSRGACPSTETETLYRRICRS